MNSWLLFAVLAPLLWGMTNPIDAGLRRNYIKKEEDLAWFFAFFHLPLAILAFIIFQVELVFNWNNMLMVLGGMFWTIPSYFYFKSVKFESPTIVALLSQMIPLWTLVIAYLFINESLSKMQLVAFLLILAGGILAAVKIKKNVFHFSKAFWFMLIACMMWAGSDVAFKYYETGFNNFTSAFVYYFLGSGIPALFALLNPKKLKTVIGNFKKLPGKAWGALVLTRSASLGGSLALTYALTLGKASLTLVIVGLQPIFALIFGYIWSVFFKFVPRESLKLKDLSIKGPSLIIIIIGLILLQS